MRTDKRAYPTSDLHQYMDKVLRERSGSVDSSDTLTLFLYLLMRDHVHTGLVEQVMQDALIAEDGIQYTNGYLANYAAYLADQLLSNNAEAETP